MIEQNSNEEWDARRTGEMPFPARERNTKSTGRLFFHDDLNRHSSISDLEVSGPEHGRGRTLLTL